MKFLRLCLAALLTLLLLTSVATDTETQKTFEVLKGSEHHFTYWQEQCVKLGGRLASINSEEEQAAVIAVLKESHSSHVITGMKRIRRHEHYINGDGIPLPYTNWQRGQPDNNGGGELCLMVERGTNPMGQWWDKDCLQGQALCEFEPEKLKSFKKEYNPSPKSAVEWDHICRNRGGRLGSVATPEEKKLAENALRGNSCPDMDNMFKERFIVCEGKVALCEFAPKTYSLVEEMGRTQTFEQWQAKCKARGLRLARINNAEEQRKAVRVIKTSPHRGVLIDSKRKYKGSTIFQNSDGQTTPYANWDRGEPNNRYEQCTQVYSFRVGNAVSKWDDTRCNALRSALCESRKFDVKNNYFIVKDKDSRDRSFDEWKRICEEKGGQLAAIHSEEAQHLAEQTLRTTNRHYVLTGMKRKAHRSQTFIDREGRIIRYTNWYPGQPDDPNGEDCIELHNWAGHFGKWNDCNCKRNAAICEKR